MKKKTGAQIRTEYGRVEADRRLAHQIVEYIRLVDNQGLTQEEILSDLRGALADRYGIELPSLHGSVLIDMQRDLLAWWEAEDIDESMLLTFRRLRKNLHTEGVIL